MVMQRIYISSSPTCMGDYLADEVAYIVNQLLHAQFIHQYRYNIGLTVKVVALLTTISAPLDSDSTVIRDAAVPPHRYGL